MILVDTSVWIDHLRNRNAELEQRLGSGQILMHPFILAELALGSLHNRKKRLAELEALLEVNVARLSEVRHMIEAHSLYSKGIGLTDAHLIASCLMTSGTQLWTRDGALQRVAEALGVLIDLP
jgi:predicted nucleic acid-binding protein